MQAKPAAESPRKEKSEEERKLEREKRQADRRALDAEKQLRFARLTGYPPTNMDAMNNLPADLARLRMSDADVQALGRLQREFDYNALFAYRDEHVERWNREVVAGS